MKDERYFKKCIFIYLFGCVGSYLRYVGSLVTSPAFFFLGYTFLHLLIFQHQECITKVLQVNKIKRKSVFKYMVTFQNNGANGHHYT